MSLRQARSKIHIPLEVMIPHILAMGLEENPYEACGLIIPDLSVPPLSWVTKMTNRAENPFNSYRLDPSTIDQLTADLGKDDRVWEDVIVWHTHPSGFVGPSREDIHHKIEGIKYLVVSLPRGEAVYF